MARISKDAPEDPSLQKPAAQREKILQIVNDENLRRCATDSLLTTLAFLSANIHDADFSILEPLSNLETLSINNAILRSPLLPLLSSVKNLKTLIMGSCGLITSSMLEEISSKEGFRKLSIISCKGMSSSDLTPLGKSRLLREINLDNNGSSRIDLGFAKELSELKSLSF